MRTHITPRHIHTTNLEFARHRPQRTAFGVLLGIVALAVAALVIWLAISDPAALLTTAALVALWLMAQGVRR